MDDATSRILSIFLVEEEDTASTFRGLHEVIGQHGLFSSFYTDRGSHYFFRTDLARDPRDDRGGSADARCRRLAGCLAGARLSGPRARDSDDQRRPGGREHRCTHGCSTRNHER